ncbi:uncharacterized protein C8Q71DRAFT_280004 [Rhodofomes roseus]|uniref:Uncharacterized protein n=1 Tax=Rhodofomes roseus TaxID=34475 RepID=A0ABQ8K5L5_9APHY|nr:uncharacterized protein C8Q71DRAFT_280004 [Rhodofomes roseus]KAH9832059.1 hypothetical protein C8Q71DRAFT_280004 [Rhodofomes roseus]
MDNSTAIALQELEAGADAIFATKYAYIASLFLTIDQQIAFIWSRKLSIPTLLLFLLHLSNMLNLITFIGGQSPLNCKVDSALYYSYLGSVIIFDIVTAVIAALRVYAINGKHWLIPTVILVLFTPEVAQGIVRIYTL